MSDAIEQNTQTQDAKPLKDWRRIIAASSLPEGSKRLIETVVRKTRLWKRERAAVAVELIAHFHDAADAGVPSEEAIKRFGDARQAAKLIRRAKIRNRSWLWHARRFAQRVLVVLFLCYIGVGVYYYTGKPSPSVDYVAKLNAPILATPESEWAWPLYREAALALKSDPMPEAQKPGDEKWDELVAWLDRHPAQIALIRDAAGRPALGSPLGHTLSDEDARLFGHLSQSPSANRWTAGSVVSVILPYLQQLRTHAAAVAADARLAIERREPDRLMSDIKALYAMSDQLRRRDVLVTDLVSLSIRGLAQDVVGTALRQAPTLFDDRALLQLVHSQAHIHTAADLVTFTGERYMFYDLVQRIYTDNGEGDGRITPVAREVMTTVASSQVWEGGSPGALEVTLAPAVLLMSASRRDLVQTYDQLMDTVERRMSQNLRDLPPEVLSDRVGALRASFADSVRYGILIAMMPAFSRVQVSAERALAQQEGLEVAIALELYRRRHGAYPESLALLVPEYLPQVPADRVTGEPVCYRIRDESPVIYSRGMDRDDDGGTAPMANGEPTPRIVAIGGEPVDGDWVLFPPP